MKPLAVCAAVYVSLATLQGGTIDVATDAQVTIGLGIWNYASQASAHGLDSPYPSEISFTLTGLPVGLPVSAIPGTSATYTPGMLFQATLESLDGAISIPLLDPNAARLGLPDGDLILGAGLYSGTSYSGPASMLGGSATLDPAEAAQLFSGGALEPWSEAFVIRILNLGDPITFGYPGSPIASAVSVSLSSADGTLSVGAIPLQVDMQDCPEPGTVRLLVLGLAAITFALCRRRPGGLHGSCCCVTMATKHPGASGTA